MNTPIRVPDDLNDLPSTVQDIAEELGIGLVQKLVQHFGGVELRIPHKLHDQHKLMVLGLDHAQALCEYCPGDTVLVPFSLDRKRLHQRVIELEEAGLKRWQIARRLGISQRHVRRLANGPQKDPRQFDMFGS